MLMKQNVNNDVTEDFDSIDTKIFSAQSESFLYCFRFLLIILFFKDLSEFD